MPKCRGCGALIRWFKTVGGKPIPVDVEPRKVLVEIRNLPCWVSVEDGYTAHWATCPKASEFRKKGKGVRWENKKHGHLVLVPVDGGDEDPEILY